MYKFIRVDMTSLSVTVGEVPEKYVGLGGRALTSGFIERHFRCQFRPYFCWSQEPPDGWNQGK